MRLHFQKDGEVTMAEDLQGLLNKIHTDGIQKAEEEKAAIIADAKKEAAKIIADAKAQAETDSEKAKAFVEKHSEIWKFIKFTFTGASTSILEMAVYAALQYGVFRSLQGVPVENSPVLEFLGIEYKGYLYSYLISAIIGYAAAFLMNRKLTFKADANPLVSSILYAIMVICTITFNTWFGAFLGTIVTNNGWSNFWVDMLLKLVVMTLPTVWTYPLSRFVIHRKKKDS